MRCLTPSLLYECPGTAILHFMIVEAMAVYSMYGIYNNVASLIISQTVDEVVETCVTDVVAITTTTTTQEGATTAATTTAKEKGNKTIQKNTSEEQDHEKAQSPWPKWPLNEYGFSHCDRSARHTCRADHSACKDAVNECHKRRLAASASATSGIEEALKEKCDPGQKALWMRVEIKHHCMHMMVASLCKKRHDGHSYPYQACYDLDSGNRHIDVEEPMKLIGDTCPGVGMLYHNLFFMWVNYSLLICIFFILSTFFYRLIGEGGLCWSFGRGAYMTLTWDLERQLEYRVVVVVMAIGTIVTVSLVVKTLGPRVLKEFIVQLVTFCISLMKLLLVDVPSFDYRAEKFKNHIFYRPALDLITKSNDAFGVRLNDALWAEKIGDSSCLRRFLPPEPDRDDEYKPLSTADTDNASVHDAALTLHSFSPPAFENEDSRMAIVSACSQKRPI